MADFPALPLWTDAYLSDCSHLSDEEHGRYLLLLMTMWRSPECRLPNDDQWLARKFRRSVGDVQTQFRPIIKEFCQGDGNWIFQKRLVHEKSFVTKHRKKMSDAAKSRWNKEKALCNSNAPTPTISLIDKSIKAEVSPESDSEWLWTTGVSYLVTHGLDERRSKNMIGKWIKSGPPKAREAVQAAMEQSTLDPVPFIERCLQPKAAPVRRIGL